jgi:hypothetical protein
MAVYANQAIRIIGRLGGTTEKRFRNRKIAGELSPLLFLEPFRNSAANILLDISRIAAKHSRQASEVLATFGAESFEDKARIRH